MPYNISRNSKTHFAVGNRASRCTRYGALSLGLGVALTLLAGRVWAADSATDPLQQTKSAVDHAIRILGDKQLPPQDKRRQLRDMAEDNFDFRDMARSALGYHWKSLNGDQRQQFSSLFSAFIENAYLNRIEEYAGQDVEFIDQKSEGPGRVSVESKVVEGDKPPVPLNFLLKQEGEGWKIYDVTIDSISITANYRNQFNRVINNQGFDKLMGDLKAKQTELAAMLGRSS